MTATVTCLGSAVQDLLFDLDSSVDIGHKNFASSLHVGGGGPAANAAVTVATLGGSARLVARLGTDSVGDAIIAGLERCDVEISRVRRIPGTPSPVSTVIVDDRGERTIVNHTDPRLVGGPNTITRQDIINSQALLVDLRWPEGAFAAIRHANDLEIPSVVDFDLTTPDSRNDAKARNGIVGSATHLIFSQPALVRLTGTADTASALESMAETTEAFVGVTLGQDGFQWLDAGIVKAFAGFDVDAVNTLGAGDVFHGAFVLGLAEGRSVDDIIRWSSAAAALKCTRLGGIESFPTRDDVASFLGEVSP